jgi:hypothetical protein
MKRLLLVVLVLAAGFSAATWLGSSPLADAQPPAKGPQWQYVVYDHSDLMALGDKRIGPNLTKLGEQGWELVAITPGIRGEKGEDVVKLTTYFFKRPR